MSRFIESIKIEDQKIHLPELHQKRILDTFSHFGKTSGIDVVKIFEQLEHDEDGLYKFRIEYDLDNNFRTQMLPYLISEIDDFELINNNQIKYNYKYADRSFFQKLKDQSQGDEIILVQNQCITDTSFSNLVFLKDEKWFTPSTYLLNGVMRQHLLASKTINEVEITLDNIKEFSHFKLINALNHFDDAIIYPIERIINLPKEESDWDLL